jgi:hypothetical protein
VPQRPPDEGNEAHQTGQYSPQHGVRDADEPEAKADHNAEAGVEDRLHQKEAAQPRSRIVKRGRAALEITCSQQAEKPIPKVLPRQQNEQ